jgi:hypothetical protein
MKSIKELFSRKNKVKELGTCGCDKPNLIHIKAHWGAGESREFLYCHECIKSDVINGILIEIM